MNIKPGEITDILKREIKDYEREIDIAETGTTSLTIAVEAIARTRNGEAETKVAQGIFKFVLLDDEDKPRPVRMAAQAALSAND